MRWGRARRDRKGAAGEGPAEQRLPNPGGPVKTRGTNRAAVVGRKREAPTDLPSFTRSLVVKRGEGGGHDLCRPKKTPGCWVTKRSGGDGLGTEATEKGEKVGERSHGSWDTGRGQGGSFRAGKMGCSFWDGGPARAASTTPGRPQHLDVHDAAALRRQNAAAA